VRALRCPKCYGNRDLLTAYVDGVAWCASCDAYFDQIEETRDLLLRLWGRSREHDPNYRTDEGVSSRHLWNRLAELLRLS
jgi:hypothetical protein